MNLINFGCLLLYFPRILSFHKCATLLFILQKSFPDFQIDYYINWGLGDTGLQIHNEDTSSDKPLK